nr:hypothetical protein Q903MT_gene1446 [Picea sitchensis]
MRSFGWIQEGGESPAFSLDPVNSGRRPAFPLSCFLSCCCRVYGVRYWWSALLVWSTSSAN